MWPLRTNAPISAVGRYSFGCAPPGRGTMAAQLASHAQDGLYLRHSGYRSGFLRHLFS